MPDLRGDSVRVRDFIADDRPGLVAMMGEEQLFRFTMTRMTPETAQGTLDQWLTEREHDDAGRSSWPKAIEVDGAFQGFVILSEVMTEVAEIQWYITPAARGRGNATEATRLVTTWARSERGFHRIFATVDPENAASVRVLEKAGFQREGLMRDYVLTHLGWRDRLMYALVG